MLGVSEFRVSELSTGRAAPSDTVCNPCKGLRMGENELHTLLHTMLDTRLLKRHDVYVRKDIADGKYAFLAPTQVIPRQLYATLTPWQAFFLRAVAVGRSMRKGVVISRAAAALHGMWTIGTTRQVEVALPSGGTPSKSKRMPLVRYRVATFRDDEVENVYGVRATTALRTFIDVARYNTFADGLVAADWLLSVRGYTPAQLKTEVHRMSRFVGKAKVIMCVDWATKHADSPFESWFRAGLIERGVRGWRFQPVIGRYRPDFLFDDFLIIEIDGKSKYAEQTAEVLLRERDRERQLTNMGYVFFRLYPEDVIQRLDDVLAEIDRARATRTLRPEGA